LTKFERFCITTTRETMKIIAQIGNIKIAYDTTAELISKIETNIEVADERLKKLGVKTKQLKKQSRAMKKVLAKIINDKTPHQQAQTV